MVQLTVLETYRDDNGNSIEFSGVVAENIRIKFTGSNNRLVVASPFRIGRLHASFECDNGLIEIGSSLGVPAFRASIRSGQDSRVLVGNNVSTTAMCVISAAEGTTVRIGDDVMIATNNEIRADDGHPIFDVKTGDRVNVSRSITIGDHVWLARNAIVLGGATIGEGSVIGHSSLVTGRIPNNCIAVGSPARVTRRDIAWERPHLTETRPFYKPDASTVTKSPYWKMTESE